jgi:hypothetical protein
VTVQSGSHDDTDPGAVRLSRSSPTPGTVVIGVGGELDAATEPTARTSPPRSSSIAPDT